MMRDPKVTTSMGDVIGVMIAAGGPTDFLVAAMYPLHLAVRELFADPQSPHSQETLEIAPVADIGWAVSGIGEGLYDLLAAGVLHTVDSQGGPRFATDADRLRAPRAQLMRCGPASAESYRRAAVLWRTRSSSLENMSLRSDHTEAAGAVMSLNPGMRRHGPVGAIC